MGTRDTLRAQLSAAKAEMGILVTNNERLQKSIEDLEDEAHDMNNSLLRFVREKAGRRDCHGVYDGIEQICNQRSTATARAEKAEAERDALAALVAELEGALQPFAGYLNGCSDVPGCRTSDAVGLWQTVNHISDLPFTYGDVRRANAAFARTPAQSLAKAQAAALREAWKKVCAIAVVAEEKNSTTFTWSDAAVVINDEAERLEAEGANG